MSKVVILLPTELHPTFGTQVTIGAQASDTIWNMKVKLHAVTGIATSKATFSFEAKELQIETMALGAYGVGDGELLTLAISGSAPAATYMVSVALPASLQA
eukprot:2877906-Prymnesium_polylepis.1